MRIVCALAGMLALAYMAQDEGGGGGAPPAATGAPPPATEGATPLVVQAPTTAAERHQAELQAGGEPVSLQEPANMLGAAKHSTDPGGVTTRHDAMDAGVPMLPGSPRERQGPEDALGAGPTRGDYSERVGPSGYNPHTVEVVPDAKPGEPRTRLVPQRQYVEQVADVPGKGGVDTAEALAAVEPFRDGVRGDSPAPAKRSGRR
jgi:hypothetical protein